MPTLIASDGYEYADFAHRVAGKPLENHRNQKVVSLRFHRSPEGFIKAWYQGWDSAREDARHSERVILAMLAVLDWRKAHPSADVYGQPGCTGGTSLPNPVPAAPAAVHPAH